MGKFVYMKRIDILLHRALMVSGTIQIFYQEFPYMVLCVHVSLLYNAFPGYNQKDKQSKCSLPIKEDQVDFTILCKL